jgi:hypothetical protein
MYLFEIVLNCDNDGITLISACSNDQNDKIDLKIRQNFREQIDCRDEHEFMCKCVPLKRGFLKFY